jgi:hypothetical protein
VYPILPPSFVEEKNSMLSLLYHLCFFVKD